MKTKGYLINRNGNQSGPYSRKELSLLWQKDTLFPDDDIFIKNSARFVKAESFSFDKKASESILGESAKIGLTRNGPVGIILLSRTGMEVR
jgi:hypothetical protein